MKDVMKGGSDRGREGGRKEEKKREKNMGLLKD
jgi:hypothetical protein